MTNAAGNATILDAKMPWWFACFLGVLSFVLGGGTAYVFCETVNDPQMAIWRRIACIAAAAVLALASFVGLLAAFVGYQRIGVSDDGNLMLSTGYGGRIIEVTGEDMLTVVRGGGRSGSWKIVIARNDEITVRLWSDGSREQAVLNWQKLASALQKVHSPIQLVAPLGD